MTPEAQRIAIAEACGWKRIWHRAFVPTVNEHDLPSGWYGVPPTHGMEVPLPDFVSDLNAMHEAEKQFHSQHLGAEHYIHELERVVYRTKQVVFQVCSATSTQRAEAFLRTIGKWVAQSTDGKDKK